MRLGISRVEHERLNTEFGAVQPAAFAQTARSEFIIKSRLIGTTSRLVDNSI